MFNVERVEMILIVVFGEFAFRMQGRLKREGRRRCVVVERTTNVTGKRFRHLFERFHGEGDKCDTTLRVGREVLDGEQIILAESLFSYLHISISRDERERARTNKKNSPTACPSMQGQLIRSFIYSK